MLPVPRCQLTAVSSHRRHLLLTRIKLKCHPLDCPHPPGQPECPILSPLPPCSWSWPHLARAAGTGPWAVCAHWAQSKYLPGCRGGANVRLHCFLNPRQQQVRCPQHRENQQLDTFTSLCLHPSGKCARLRRCPHHRGPCPTRGALCPGLSWPQCWRLWREGEAVHLKGHVQADRAL